jgi:hypothetical protein
MAAEEERTGFEWMDTPFIITRTLASLFGGACLVLLFGAVLPVVSSLIPVRTPPPSLSAGPEGEMEVYRSSCCWETHPFRDLALALVFTALPITGMISVWFKPWLGFLLSAGGWLLACLSTPLTSLEPDYSPLGTWQFWALFLLPPLWLGFASLRCGTRAQESGRDPGIRRQEYPDIAYDGGSRAGTPVERAP